MFRQTVFGWTTQKFPFTVKTAHTLKILGPHVITVTGKAFYDLTHAPADHFKPATLAERLRRLGNSSGNATASDSMKYWEIIINKIIKAGFSVGWVSALNDYGHIVWTVDAHRDGKRFIVRAEEILTAFVELQRAIHEFAVSLLS